MADWVDKFVRDQFDINAEEWWLFCILVDRLRQHIYKYLAGDRVPLLNLLQDSFKYMDNLDTLKFIKDMEEEYAEFQREKNNE